MYINQDGHHRSFRSLGTVTIMSMPLGTQPESGPFARAISAEIRSSMARHRVSGAELARRTSRKSPRSPGYINKRLRDEVALTANDIEDICEVLGEDLMTLIHAAVRATRNGQMHRP